MQGWEFAHRFFEPIAHFLWAKEQFACEKEQIAPFAILSWAKGVNRSRSPFCKERQERFAQSCCFLKSNERESLPSLFKKEWLSEERREQFALGHKKGEQQSKTYEKEVFFKKIVCLFRAIHLNHEWITDVALLKRNWEQFAHSRSALLSWATRAICSGSLFFKERWERIAQSRSIIWAILSEGANSQPCKHDSANPIAQSYSGN